MAGNELVQAQQFSSIEVQAKVSLDDLLDLKVGEYEKKLRNAAKEIEMDIELCGKELERVTKALEASYNTVGFAEHTALANDMIKYLGTFLKLEQKMFDVECRGSLVPHEKRESVVQMSVVIVNRQDNRSLVRLHVRKLIGEEKKLLKDIERINKAIETDQQYRLQLDKAKSDIPLIRRDLKNEVTRKKLEAAGETQLLASIDKFEVPVLPKSIVQR